VRSVSVSEGSRDGVSVGEEGRVQRTAWDIGGWNICGVMARGKKTWDMNE
jgi:hypothetical protein